MDSARLPPPAGSQDLGAKWGALPPTGVEVRPWEWHHRPTPSSFPLPSAERNRPPWRPDRRRCLPAAIYRQRNRGSETHGHLPGITQQRGTGGKPPAPRLIGYSLETWMPWEISPSRDGISVQMSEKEWFQSRSLTMATASP